MTAIVCTTIICITFLLCVVKICETWKPVTPAQQLGITEEELEEAYKKAEADKVPDFQDVLEAINREIAGLAEDDNEG